MVPNNTENSFIIVLSRLRGESNDNSCLRSRVNYTFFLAEPKNILFITNKLKLGGKFTLVNYIYHSVCLLISLDLSKVNRFTREVNWEPSGYTLARKLHVISSKGFNFKLCARTHSNNLWNVLYLDFEGSSRRNVSLIIIKWESQIFTIICYFFNLKWSRN